MWDFISQLFSRRPDRSEIELVIDFDLRFALFGLECALGVSFAGVECERVFRDAADNQVSPKQYTFFTSPRLSVTGRVDEYEPESVWVRVEGFRGCAEILRRVAEDAESHASRLREWLRQDLIATTEIVWLSPDGSQTKIVAGVGNPYQEDRCWRCPVMLRGLHENLRPSAGVDSLQALSLALALAGSLLQRVLDDGGRLIYPGTDGDFPIRSYFPDWAHDE